MRVLVFFAEIPKSFFCVLVESLTNENYDRLCKCNGQFINAMEDTLLQDWLCNFFYDETDGRFLHKKVEGPVFTPGELDAVVITGFGL